MPKKATNNTEPTTQPRKRKVTTEAPVEPEAQVDVAPEKEMVTETKPKAKAKRDNPKALEGKEPDDRHPITATIPVKKREGLTAFAGNVKASEELNPEGVNVALGTVASMFAELAYDIIEGEPQAIANLKAIATSETPADVIARMAVEFKQAQKAS